MESFEGLPVFGGLDLSSVSDLTALVLMAPKTTDAGTVWHVKPTFWLPGDSLRERAKADRVPYDVWHENGYLHKTPGPTVEYEHIAEYLRGLFDTLDIRKIAFDSWNWNHLKPWLTKAGFTEDQLDGDDAVFEEFRQGYRSMSPAMRDLESLVLTRRIAHGGHPVLTNCMMNAVVATDSAGNRKLEKTKSHGRIDGAVALLQAAAIAGTYEDDGGPSFWEVLNPSTDYGAPATDT
jgi:phage terminase large subunit-like protein